MRNYLSVLLVLVSLTATAQTALPATLTARIDDDDRRLSIQIDGTKAGHTVQYARTFDVTGMSRSQKDALQDQVLDSLGLGDSPTPPPSANHEPLLVTFSCPTCAGRTRLFVGGGPADVSLAYESTIEQDKPAFSLALRLSPGEYRYIYWQNRVLQMELPFTVKAGQANTVQVK